MGRSGNYHDRIVDRVCPWEIEEEADGEQYDGRDSHRRPQNRNRSCQSPRLLNPRPAAPHHAAGTPCHGAIVTDHIEETAACSHP